MTAAHAAENAGSPLRPTSTLTFGEAGTRERLGEAGKGLRFVV